MAAWFAENGLLLGLAALDGLAYAALVFMVAVGLNLVFGVLRIVNVAHGSLFAIGAYAAASIGLFFAARGLPPAAGLPRMEIGFTPPILPVLHSPPIGGSQAWRQASASRMRR